MESVGAILGGGALLAAMLFAAAVLGGPKWGIVPVALIFLAWMAACLYMGQTETEQMGQIIVAAVLICAVYCTVKGRWDG